MILKNPLVLAHQYWKNLLNSGDLVIDATCGNGRDSLVLASLVLTEHSGKLFCIDIQKEAILQTNILLENHLPPSIAKRVIFQKSCHSLFPGEIQEGTVTLVVYNLGYLPGSDKSIKTNIDSTKTSIERAMPLIKEGGMISITCYPGHEEGMEEEKALVQLTASLSPAKWTCCHHRWINRNLAPSLLILQKHK